MLQHLPAARIQHIVRHFGRQIVANTGQCIDQHGLQGIVMILRPLVNDEIVSWRYTYFKTHTIRIPAALILVRLLHGDVTADDAKMKLFEPGSPFLNEGFELLSLPDMAKTQSQRYLDNRILPYSSCSHDSTVGRSFYSCIDFSVDLVRE